MNVTAYHGGSAPIRRFAYKYSTQGGFWFSEDREKILRGESGAGSVRYLMTCELSVDKVAGWPEYGKWSLGELKQNGYDSVHLDDDWVVLDSRRVRVRRVEEAARARRPR